MIITGAGVGRQINNIEPTTKTHKPVASSFFSLNKKKITSNTRVPFETPPPPNPVICKRAWNDKDLPARMTAVAGLRKGQTLFLFQSSAKYTTTKEKGKKKRAINEGKTKTKKSINLFWVQISRFTSLRLVCLTSGNRRFGIGPLFLPSFYFSESVKTPFL